MKEMFEASVDGRPYDTDKWGAYYRPFGVQSPSNNNDNNQQAAATKPAVVDEEDDAPAASSPVVVPKATSNEKAKAQDILAQIRARQVKA